MSRLLKCSAAGDAIMLRRLPGHYEGFDELRDFIDRADFRYVNLECSLNDYELCGGAESGGSWLVAPPKVLDDVKAFGFNILNTANNHAMDFAHEGLLKTMEYIRRADLPFAGTGRNLAEASAPAYLDTLNGRFALIGGSTSFHEEDRAGEQNRYMPGRPGLNPLRSSRKVTVTEEQLKVFREVAKAAYLNAARDISQSEGYCQPIPDDQALFGGVTLEVGQQVEAVYSLNEKDAKRLETAINEARFMSDYVAVSIHSHEPGKDSKEIPSRVLEMYAHRCIDAGADCVIGTGPHLLRPIEIYKGKPIFYCLGDFVLQLETLKCIPADMYEKYGLDMNMSIAEMMDIRSHHGKVGLPYLRVMSESVVPYWEVEDGKLTRLELLPIELGFGEHRSVSGWPRPKKDAGILERLQKMSEPYGTRIRIEDGIGVVEL